MNIHWFENTPTKVELIPNTPKTMKVARQLEFGRYKDEYFPEKENIFLDAYMVNRQISGHSTWYVMWVEALRM